MDEYSSARDYAVLALDAAKLPGFPRQTFRRRSAVAPADPRDRALGETITAGVLKNLGLLDYLLGMYATRPPKDVDPRSRLILLVGLYQLRFLDRVPPHAVVDEAVRQARTLERGGLGRSMGFVNAVLREAARRPEVPLPSRDDPLLYLEVVFSQPADSAAKILDLLGPADAFKFAAHANTISPTLVRLFPGRGPDELRRDHVTVVPHETPGLFVVSGAKSADFALYSSAGIAQVQDATSASAIDPLGVLSGEIVLDACCGVGTKTRQLAEKVGDAGRVFATDSAGRQVSTLIRTIRADAGPDRVWSRVIAKRAESSADHPDDWPAQFDRILVDAPCSNSGVFARRPEARYRQADDVLSALETVQRFLLADRWPRLRPGGRLAYVTCSVWPRENDGIVDDFLASTPDARETKRRSTMPAFDADDPTRYHDGGFVSVIEKQD